MKSFAGGRQAAKTPRGTRRLRAAYLIDDDYAFALSRARHLRITFSLYVEWLVARDRKGQTP